MRAHMSTHHVNHLAMPRIGCGLDGLEWDKVKLIIQRVFKQTECEITIYTLKHSREKEKKNTRA
jgi:O-acetyl-ADP-ribose deacetylase (regulator of RNase III)